mmetsp:Transcript_18748/g.39019  ORF Transcript_18748/g.39019 Transcript_18748/m.39019 type:complete len:271 (-) Transcript_18748:80-892(-)
MPVLVLVVDVPAVLLQELGDLDVPVLSSNVHKGVSVVEGLVEVEAVPLVVVDVLRSVFLHKLHPDKVLVKSLGGHLFESLGQLLVFAVPDPACHLVDIESNCSAKDVIGLVAISSLSICSLQLTALLKLRNHIGIGARRNEAHDTSHLWADGTIRVSKGWAVESRRRIPACQLVQHHLPAPCGFCLLKPAHRVEDLLPVQSVLDAERILKVVVIQIVQKRSVNSCVQERSPILSKGDALEPPADVGDAPCGYPDVSLVGHLTWLEIGHEP